MNLLTKQIYGNKKAITYNTYIGGVSATISTDALLATKLGISVARIENFTIDGSDIKCKITGSYYIPDSAFKSNKSITKYIDYDGLVTSIIKEGFRESTIVEISLPNCIKIDEYNYLSFYNCTSLTTVSLPKLTTINTQTFMLCTALVTLDLPELTNVKGVFSFANMTSLTTLNIKKCINLGENVANNNIFNTIKIGVIINTNIALQTCNSGSADGDLQYAIASRSAIVNYI